jgi:hypothetical protein
VVDGQRTIELDQQCGGHIDPNSFEAVGYITMKDVPMARPKGFICPLGQICLVCSLFKAADDMKLNYIRL